MKNVSAFRFTVMAAAVAASSQTFALEEFFATPGTRAMGMAGAYVAHASDSSAIWYNPAALDLTRNFSDATIDYGDFIKRKSEDEIDVDDEGYVDWFETETNIKYVAFSGSGFGVAFFQPYNFSSSVVEEDFLGNQSLQQVNTTYQELKFAFATDLNEYVSVGAGFDLINQELDCPDCSSFGSESSAGFGYSLGTIGRWTLNKGTPNPVTVKLGANYRSEAAMDDLVLLDFEQDVVPSRPASLSYGASVGVPFMVGSLPVYIAGSLHLESVSYGETQRSWYSNGQPVFDSFEFEEDRTAMGLEVSFLVNDELDLYVRMGSASTEVTDDGNGAYDEEPYSTGTESSTLGFGARFNELVFDLAMESRTIEESDFYSDIEDEDEDLISMSVSFTF